MAQPVREALTNREVYDMLLERNTHKERQGKFTAPIEQNSMAYLQQQQIEQQSADQIAEFLAAIEEHNFSEEEKLQLVNLRPQTEIELSLILYDYTPEQAQEIFRLLQELFYDMSTA